MIDWKNISLGDLAGFLSEELRKRGIDTTLVEEPASQSTHIIDISPMT